MHGSFNLPGMLASALTTLLEWRYLLSSPASLLIFAFQIWMFIHAIRQREYIWAVFIIIGWGLAAICYYFFIYRATPSATRGFELPGAHDRRRKFITSIKRTTTFSLAISISNKANSTKPRHATGRRSNANRRISIPARISGSACFGSSSRRKHARYWKGLLPKTPNMITAIR